MASAVVVVLSPEFKTKEYPMGEVRQILEQRRAKSKQQVCIVLHGITYEECSQGVLDGYAVDMEQLLGIALLRSDQARTLTP
jgi:hypothetical protein